MLNKHLEFEGLKTPEDKPSTFDVQKEDAMSALRAIKDYAVVGDLSYESMIALLDKIKVVTDNDTNNDMLSPGLKEFFKNEELSLESKIEAISNAVTAQVLSETPESKKPADEIKDNNDSQFKLPEIGSIPVNIINDENKIEIGTAELEKNKEVAPLSLKDVKDIPTGGSIKVSPVVNELPDIDIDKILNSSVTVEKSVIPPKIEENKVKKLEMIDEAIKENSIFDLERKNFMISKSALEIFNRPSYISESKVEKTKFIYKTPKDADLGFEFFKNSVDVKLRDVIDKAEKLGYVLCPLSEVLETFNNIVKPKKGKRLFPATKPIYDFKGNKVYFADINYEVGKNTIDTINYDYVLKGDETLLFIEKNK